MPLKAILFDFDDTLAPEAESFVEALRTVGRLTVEAHAIDLESLVKSVQDFAGDEWRKSRLFGTGAVRGVGYSEVFSSSFWEQDIGLELQAEGDRIRPIAWRRALAEHSVIDESLVEALVEASAAQGTGPHTPYAGTAELIETLRARLPLGVVTNGDSKVQRRKVNRSGLEPMFRSIVVSGDFGLTVAKPDPEPFQKALDDLGVLADEAIMVGNDEVSDIHGAARLGIRTVWVNRTGSEFTGPSKADHEIADLRELPKVLGL